MADAAIPAEAASASRRQPWYSVLYIQVLIAIALGVLIGHFHPTFGEALKPLGDGFIALIKMMIAPVIFCTVVHGIATVVISRCEGELDPVKLQETMAHPLAIGEAMERKPITL